MTRPEATLPEHTECVRADLRGGPRVSRTPGALARASYANCCPGRENNCSSEVNYSDEPQNPRFAGASRGRCFLPGPRTDCCLPTGKRTHHGDRTGTRTPQPPSLGRLAPPAPRSSRPRRFSCLSQDHAHEDSAGPRAGLSRFSPVSSEFILGHMCVWGGRVCS